MKRILSIFLTVCILLGLLGTVTFAAPVIPPPITYVDVDDTWVDISLNSIMANNSTISHSNRLALTGDAVDCTTIKGGGTIYVEFHNYTTNNPDGAYNALQVSEGTTVYATFYGENVFASCSTALYVDEDCDLYITVAENSSVKFETLGEEAEAKVCNGAIEANGGELPEPDANGDITVSNGTPAPCVHTFEYESDTACVMYCSDNVLATVNHELTYGMSNDEHKGECINCGHEFASEKHTISYYMEGEEGCYPYCYECDYEGDLIPHELTAFDTYDEEYCINYCARCGYGNPETGLVKHELETKIVEATRFEGLHTYTDCDVCGYIHKEYSRENAIYFEMTSPDGYDWDNSFMIVLENGEPLTLVRKYSTNEREDYALPFNKDSSYAIIWVGRDECNSDFGLDIYFPNEDEPVYSAESMEDEPNISFLYEYNYADYEEFYYLMDELPDKFEYYTQESVDRLAKAIKKINYHLPKNKQAELDAVTTEIMVAYDALVPTVDPSGFGLINLKSDEICIDVYDEDEYYYYQSGSDYYDWDGDYTIFNSQGINFENIWVFGGDVDITTVGLMTPGMGGSIGIYGSSNVNLTALGTNLFAEIFEGYAGIEVVEGASLTITEDSENIIAIGTEYCAGIGSYNSKDELGNDFESEPAGKIIINGGVVFALALEDAAGIGGAEGEGFDEIIINGGRIHAECTNDDGAGIGAGDDGEGGYIIINGGDITALSLDDDGAGIGGADNGYVDSITINGGNLLVGTDDAARIGGGESSSSYGGKIIINGGVIRTHFDDSSDYYIGNDGSNETGATDYNFVQINGGNIIGDGIISPIPVNKNGDELEKITLTLNKENSKKDKVTLVLSNGDEITVDTSDGEVSVYIPKGATVKNEETLTHDHQFKNYKYNNDATPLADGTETGTCICGETDTRTKAGTKLPPYNFKDVKGDKWYKDVVYYAANHGLMTGVSADEFAPDVKLNRATFVTILAKVEGVFDSLTTDVKTGFSDVPSGKWYAGTVKWAVDVGVTNGMGDGTFAPLKEITREQMCTMFGRYLEYAKIKLDTTVNKKESFKDDKDISSWAKTYVYNCQMAGIVNGMGDGTFAPKGTAIRAQAASIFSKFHQSYLAK